MTLFVITTQKLIHFQIFEQIISYVALTLTLGMIRNLNIKIFACSFTSI